MTEIANQFTVFNTILNSFLTILTEVLPKVMPLIMYLIGAIIVLLLNYFAYRFGERWLFIAGGFSLMAYGFSLWHYIPYLSILLVITGIYHLGKAKWDKKAWNKEE